MWSLMLALALIAPSPFGFATSPAVDTFEGSYLATNMAWMQLTVPQKRTGPSFPIILTVQPYAKGNLGRLDGVCTRVSAQEWDCRMNDNWKQHISLRMQGTRVTVVLVHSVLFPELPNTGAVGRSPYDSDFYSHEVEGTFVLAHFAATPAPPEGE